MKEPKSRIRKGTLTKEYYLLAKDGDSVLYNGWYTIKELIAKDECKVGESGIRIRMKEIGVDDKYSSLWDALTKEKTRKKSIIDINDIKNLLVIKQNGSNNKYIIKRKSGSKEDITIGDLVNMCESDITRSALSQRINKVKVNGIVSGVKLRKLLSNDKKQGYVNIPVCTEERDEWLSWMNLIKPSSLWKEVQ